MNLEIRNLGVNRLLDHLPIIGSFRERNRLEVLLLAKVIEDLVTNGFTESYIKEGSNGWLTSWQYQKVNLLGKSDRKFKVCLSSTQVTKDKEIDQNVADLDIDDDIKTGIILGVHFHKSNYSETFYWKDYRGKTEIYTLYMKRRREQNSFGGHNSELLFHHPLSDQIDFLNVVLGSSFSHEATQLAFDQAVERLTKDNELVSVVWNNVPKAGLI